MTNRKLRYSGLGLAVLTASAIVACSSSDPTNPVGGAGTGSGGKPSAGGAPATSGAPGTAGSGVGGSAAGAAPTAGTGGAAPGFACTGTAPTGALITDFSNLVANPTSAGNYTFAGGVLGGTFTYQANALTLDTVGNTVLNVKGNIKAYDGFGLYFNTCYNAATYTGISFNIKGNVGPKGKLNFRVQTNSNTAIDTPNMKGRCVATNPADTYPDCHSASFDIPVTAAGGVVSVNFSQFAGGLPSDTVSAAEIVGLEWAFDWTPAPAAGGAGAGGAAAGGAAAGGASAGTGGSGGAQGGAGGTTSASAGAAGATTGAGGAAPAAGPYDADVTIDNIQFLGGPPAGGAGGASSGGSSSGGTSSAGTSAGGATAGAATAGGAGAGTAGASGGSGGTGG